MEVGLVTKIDIDREMQQAYLDYAMSTIVARALPDARDGLKPVHRRILYAMYDMGIRPDSAYKKSARIVGEVLGKYHPHGDQAVYDSMARMAQDFSLRYMLVDGQGNFGSQDDDPPAAMRYTEARLTSMAAQMLADIGKNTVDFSDNFDGTLQEPTVLPSAVPNLLVNGSSGIAVGMATSIPPHNLGEIVDAMQYMLAHWEKLDDVGVEDLMAFVKGPDFPTGGVIIHEESGDGLMAAYSTGRGRVSVQARAHLEEMERGRSRIIVTELPYLVYKAPLVSRIAELVREERLEGIVDLRDESDRQGMRIVIELNKTAEPEAVLHSLYKHTPMQSTFSINILALVGGEPRTLGLKQALRVYIEHRLEIVRRRSEYDLEKARQRAHILEGLRVALKHLDEIIDLIRKSPDAETAHARLMKRYRLSDLQAQAILDMPLKRLAALERKKIEDEYREVTALIKSLEALLKSPKRMRQVISEELAVVRETYIDRRRTHIVGLKEGESRATFLTSGDLQPDKTIWVSVTGEGLISRTLDENQPRLSGKEAPICLVQASTRDTLYLVCEQGEAAAIPVHALPESESPADGTPLEKVSPLRESNRLVGLMAVPPRSRDEGENILEKWFVITATRQGMVKKSALSELPGPSANTFTLVRVNENDQLGWLKISTGKGEILLLSAKGMAIRFSEDEVRPMGLVAAGVTGMKLESGDELAGMETLPQAGEAFMVATDGTAKRVKIDQFPKQGRYGQGVTAWKLPGATRAVGLTIGKGNARAILHLHKLAPKAIRLDEAPLQGRAARGASIQEIKPGDRVVGLVIPWEPPRPGGALKKGTKETTRVTKGAKEAKVVEAASVPGQLEFELVARGSAGELRAAAEPRAAKELRTTKDTKRAKGTKEAKEMKAAVDKPASRSASGGGKRGSVKPGASKLGASSPATAKASRATVKTAAKESAGATKAATKGTKTATKGAKEATKEAKGVNATARKPAASKPATSKPATSKPATSKPATSKPASSKPAPATTKGATKGTRSAKEAKGVKTLTRRPAASKPSASKPAISKPATSKPATSKPATSKTATSKPAASKPATSKPAPGKAAASRPATSKPAASKPAASTPAKSKPATSKSAANKSAASKPATSKAGSAAGKKPAAKTKAVAKRTTTRKKTSGKK